MYIKTIWLLGYENNICFWEGGGFSFDSSSFMHTHSRCKHVIVIGGI
jgi:hypothetical protein